MKQLLVVLLALASCTAEPPEPVVKRPPPKPATAPEAPLPIPPAPVPPSVPPPAPMPKPPPPLEPEVFRVTVELDLKPPPPPPQSDSGKIHLPAFTIRTMDHAVVDVGVNGYRTSTTSCLWSVCEGLEFDPKITVPDWPPAGAKYVGVSRTGRHEAEVWIARGEDVSLPHLKNGEHVLYVKGSIGGCPLLGALRLYVGKPGKPYRYTDYSPVMDMESELAMRYSRTMWFEATKTE